MENRQYSHRFSHLETCVYKEITPTILDVPPVRTGHDPIKEKSFGITLNVWNLLASEVRFSLLEEKFLRFEASHTERRHKDHTYAHRCKYFFYVPDSVDKDRLVVEWYKDHRVYISERDPEPLRTCVFADDEEAGVPPRKVSRGEKDRGESSSSGKDVASRTASKESVEPEEVAIEVESVSKESEGMVKDFSSQITLGSERESGPKEGASEKETLEGEEDVSIVKEVLSQMIARSEKESRPKEDASEKESLKEGEDISVVKEARREESGRKEAASEKEISEEEEDRIIVEELLTRRDTGSEKGPASGDKDLSAQSTSSYEKESIPKDDSATEEVEKDIITHGIGWKRHYEELNKLLQNVDQKATGRTLKPVFVDKKYYAEADLIDHGFRDLEDKRIKDRFNMWQ